MKQAVFLGGMFVFVSLFHTHAWARDWFVSAQRGRGSRGTRAQPAKDIGPILRRLKPGDRIHIAEGVYLGRRKSGSYAFGVPVSIIGGYNDTFVKRDPWGDHRTIFSGDNRSRTFTSAPSLLMDLRRYRGPARSIVIDGLIIDHGGRNRYQSKKQRRILLSGSEKDGEHPSPNRGGLVVQVGRSRGLSSRSHWVIVLKNNVVMNTHQNRAALRVSGYRKTRVRIHNNLVIQNSGTGIYCGSTYKRDNDLPKFLVTHNTVLFTWDGGVRQAFNIGFARRVLAKVTHNVFGFADRYAVWNGRNTRDIILSNNIVTGAGRGDYLEYYTPMKVEDMPTMAQNLYRESTGNITKQIRLPLTEDFARAYAAWALAEREQLTAEVPASNGDSNALRNMLGVTVSDLDAEELRQEIHLHRMSIDEAVEVGSKMYDGHGCQRPPITSIRQRSEQRRK